MRWAGPGGQSQLIAAGAAGQEPQPEACPVSARRQDALPSLFSLLRGLLYAHTSLGVFGRPEPLAGFSSHSAAVTGGWASGKVGRPLADP